MVEFRHGKLTEVVLHDFIASPYLKSASSGKTIEVADTTGFGQHAKTYITGQNDGSFSLGGMFDGSPEAIDELFSSLTAQEAPYPAILFYDSGIHVGRSCRMAQVRQTSYDIESPVGDVVSLSVELQADRGLRNGFCLVDKPALTASMMYPGVNWRFSSPRGGRAYVSVPQNNRDTATTLTIQHSSDNAVWVDLATQVIPAGSTASYILETSGTVEQYVRANVQLATGTGSATVIVAYARN